ncbi:MAG TPA: ATP-binding protein [Syntrophales bacterium]|nr:ATP-binding protein [Syntrophales bacterium]
MAQLQEAVRNLKQGKGCNFSILGDAGTGQSRLIEEFRASLDLNTIQWREGHAYAYAYAQHMPYFPLVDLLSRALHIKDGDSPDTVRGRVESQIRYLLENEEGVIPYIGTIYSLSYPEEKWKSFG